MRCWLLSFAVLAFSCVTLTPDGARVAVYQAPLGGESGHRGLPRGCRLRATLPPTTMTELELEGQKDPFRVERNRAAAEGANLLLVLTRMTLSRRDLECPSASPITDCPPSSGAWYRVVVECYACTADALRALPPVQHGATGQ
jgi:hypothetical protein